MILPPLFQCSPLSQSHPSERLPALTQSCFTVLSSLPGSVAPENLSPA